MVPYPYFMCDGVLFALSGRPSESAHVWPSEPATVITILPSVQGSFTFICFFCGWFSSRNSDSTPGERAASFSRTLVLSFFWALLHSLLFWLSPYIFMARSRSCSIRIVGRQWVVSGICLFPARWMTLARIALTVCSFVKRDRLVLWAVGYD